MKSDFLMEKIFQDISKPSLIHVKVKKYILKYLRGYRKYKNEIKIKFITEFNHA